MQKTGCTHIAFLMNHLFEGKRIGKHNAATDQQIESGKYFISSIRNPWDWYLSLWTSGVQGDGALKQRLTTRNIFRSFKSSFNKRKSNYINNIIDELSKDINQWNDVYDRSDSVGSFRNWLKLMHNPGSFRFFGEGYGNAAISGLCGFMTYRYLKLCCRNATYLNSAKYISNYADLLQFERSYCYIDFFIRQENLEDDLCKALENVRPLSKEEKAFIYNTKKINASRRDLSLSDYYDAESIELIRQREGLLINKFGYSSPSA